MGSKTYALAEGEAKRLQVKWRGRFNDVILYLDGQQLNPEPFSSTALRRGEAVSLPDGSRLFISRERGGLEINRDGSPIPGSSTNPRSAARGAAAILWVIAGFTLILEIMLFVSTGDVQLLGIGTVVLFAVLGVLVFRGSLAALWVGVTLYLLDSAIAVLAVIVGAATIGSLAIRALFVIQLIRALLTMREQHQQERDGVEPSAPLS